MKEIRLLRSFKYFEEHSSTDMVYGECLYMIPWGKSLERILVETSTLRPCSPLVYPTANCVYEEVGFGSVGLVDTDLSLCHGILILWARIAMGGRVDFIPEILAQLSPS